MTTDGTGAAPATRALLRALAEEEVPPEPAAAAEMRRRRVVEATALAIAREARANAARKRRLQIGVAFAAAAALVVTAGAGWRLRSGARVSDGAVAHASPIAGSLVRTHQGESLPPSAELGPGDEVATEPGGRGEVVLADGVALTLESGTQVRLPETKQDPAETGREEVGLSVGKVSVHVPPMRPGHTFSIRTPDAEVTVHGTTFSVEIGGVASATDARAARAATRVAVTSGVVSVSSAGREAVLTAGMEWASPSEATPAVAVAPAPASETPGASAPPKVSATVTRPGHHASAAPSVTPKSRLGEENQLLSTAIAASSAGDYAGAVATLDDLLRRFPGSTLAQEAHVERFRALSRQGDAAAAGREARLYLALYPDGFAREEAKSLAVGW